MDAYPDRQGGAREPAPLLSVRDITVRLSGGPASARAVHNVSFDVRHGERLGIIGESGSGKTLTAMAIMRLLNPRLMSVEGSIIYDGRNLLEMPQRELKSIRGKEIGMIFQEPLTALDPTFSIGDQISETLLAHFPMPRREAWDRSVVALQSVGIPAPEKRMHDYPHMLSGGMRQRVVIAIALVCNPKLVIADEPTTALDVTIQAQILDLIVKLCDQKGSSLILISHNLGVVAETCHRMVTMYSGQVVEEGKVGDVLSHPRHPYTAKLLASMPNLTPRNQDLPSIPGRMPLMGEIMPGCRFAPRCSFARGICYQPQSLLHVGQQLARCIRSPELAVEGQLA